VSIELWSCDDNNWELLFFDRFKSLSSLYDGPKLWQNPKEGMDYVDTWLEQIAKLKAFW
jgi:hypothetical protein